MASATTQTATRSAADTPNGERVDTAHLVETPEGVDFRQRPAGPVNRFWAACIDVGFRTAFLAGTSALFSLFGMLGMGIQLIVSFIAIWGYPIGFEMWWNGKTPGKMWFDLQVRHTDGTPVSWKGSIVRNLLRAADFLPVGYLFGLISVVANKRFQRIGDLAADTVVCHATSPEDLTEMELPDSDPLPVPVRLSPEEQAAVVRFAVRSSSWSRERRYEIAREAAGLTRHGRKQSGADPHDETERLQRMASAIVEGR